MKKVIFTSLISLVFIINVNAANKYNVTLSKCVDGDTAVFKYDGNNSKFRFLAIDTPESVHPTKGVEPYGKEASDYTCAALTNASKIQIEFDEHSDKQDKYGRYLAWIYVDGEILQKKLIENGLARVAYIYGKYTYLDELYNLQNIAYSKKVGIWSDEEIKYTVTFKSYKQTKKVEVSALEKIAEIKPNNKEGYKFLYWTLDDKEYDFNTPVTNNLKLVAKYEKQDFISSIIDNKYGYLFIILIVIILFLVSPKTLKKMLKKL